MGRTASWSPTCRLLSGVVPARPRWISTSAGGTFKTKKGHPCGDAYEALIEAGYQPEVIETGGWYRTDPIQPVRNRVRQLYEYAHGWVELIAAHEPA